MLEPEEGRPHPVSARRMAAARVSCGPSIRLISFRARGLPDFATDSSATCSDDAMAGIAEGIEVRGGKGERQKQRHPAPVSGQDD